MRPGGHKRKGNAYENNIAKRLSLWLTRGAREDVLQREKTSGATSTVAADDHRIHTHTAGDLVAVAEEGMWWTYPFLTECKHVKNIHAEGLLYHSNPNTGLYGYWRVLNQKCRLYDKAPALIFRRNTRPDMLVLEWFTVARLGLEPYIHTAIYVAPDAMHMLPLATFLTEVNPDSLRECYERQKSQATAPPSATTDRRAAPLPVRPRTG